MANMRYTIPTEDAWNAHVLRTRGEPFDSGQLLEWYTCLRRNWALNADENSGIDHTTDPTSDEIIYEHESRPADSISLDGRTHFSLALPASSEHGVDNLEYLYEYVGNKLLELGILNAASITLDASRYDNVPNSYPYLTIWFDRPTYRKPS